MDLNLMLSSKYRVPAALRAIALDPREVVVRASTGLDLGELRGEGLIGGKTPQMMLLWGMEAFSNPEAIETTVNYAHDHPDERPTIVASDVDGFTLDGFEAPKPEGVATLRQANVKNLTVRNCPGLPDLEPASHP